MNAPSASAATDVVRLRIPRKGEFVAVARLAIGAIAGRTGFSIEEIEDIKLAVAEACTEAIRFGGDEPDVELVCESSGGGLSVTVLGFVSPAQRESFESVAGEDREPSDLGLFLIRALMDRVEHRSTGAGGIDLIMSKRMHVP